MEYNDGYLTAKHALGFTTGLYSFMCFNSWALGSFKDYSYPPC